MMRTQNRGFSLVELLVAVAISMVAMIALSELYSSTRQTYRLQTMQSRLSEDGRFTVSMLQRLISQAGYRSSSDAMPTRIVATLATSTQIQFTGDNTNTVKCDGSTVNGLKTITISSDGTTLKCNDGADTIWIAASSGGNGTELVDFRIGYGIDTAATHAGLTTVAQEYSCGNVNKDCVADSYVYGFTAASVVSVKACVILRSETTDSSVVKPNNVKQCDGVTDVANSRDDRKLYRTFNTTVLLKNR